MRGQTENLGCAADSRVASCRGPLSVTAALDPWVNAGMCFYSWWKPTSHSNRLFCLSVETTTAAQQLATPTLLSCPGMQQEPSGHSTNV